MQFRILNTIEADGRKGVEKSMFQLDQIKIDLPEAKAKLKEVGESL